MQGDSLTIRGGAGTLIHAKELYQSTLVISGYMPGHYIIVKNQTGGNPHEIKTMFDSLNKK